VGCFDVNIGGFCRMNDDEIMQLVEDILLIKKEQQVEILEIISAYKNQQEPLKPVVALA